MAKSKQDARRSGLAIDEVATSATRQLIVKSNSFPAGQPIPDLFSGYGASRSPALSWTGEPGETKSTAVLVEDPDAEGGPFVHWVLFNVPPQVREIPEDVSEGESIPTLGGACQGRTSAGRLGYFGPRPPKSDPPHHYHFEVFALDQTLNLRPGAKRADVVKAMKDHVLAAGDFVGIYQAQRT